MSTAIEITRIQTARNTIRTKLNSMGLVESTAKIDVLATAVDNIKNNGSVSANVKEGETYTIPQGYHDGTGTVAGVAGGGNYTLQSKTVTPTKQQQAITSDEGYYGLSDVMVGAIPEAYQDVTSVTAAAGDVLANKMIVTSDGTLTAGTMPNNGAVEKKLTVDAPSYTVPAGYHNGEGAVSVDLETKAATPTKAEQTINPSTGKLLSSVTVAPIPEAYQDVTGVTAGAADVLTGKTIVDATGAVVEGSMADNGAVAQVLDTATTSYTVPQGYHNGEGKVEIALESKTATPTEAEQVITPTAGKVLDKVTVAPIPEDYIKTDDADAVAAEILVDKTAYVNGEKVIGTMVDNGAVTQLLDVTTKSYTVPQGYHNGEGKVEIVTETKTATPTKSEQVITPAAGKVLEQITVAAIPDAYQDVTGVTAGAADVLTGKTIVDATGAVVEGSMANNGAMNKTIDGLTVTSIEIPAGYTSGGTVSLTTDIEEALAAI